MSRKRSELEHIGNNEDVAVLSLYRSFQLTRVHHGTVVVLIDKEYDSTDLIYTILFPPPVT